MFSKNIRLDESQLKRLDRIAKSMSQKNHGMRVTRSDALRVAADIGLLSLEAEHSLPPLSAA